MVKKIYKIEVLIFILVGLAGALIATLTILGFIGGVVIMCLTSYFLISVFKKEMIRIVLDNKEAFENTSLSEDRNK